MLPKIFIITLLCLVVSLIIPATLAKGLKLKPRQRQKKRQTQTQTHKMEGKHMPAVLKATKCKGKRCNVENISGSDPFEASEIRVQLEEDGPIAQFSSKTLKATAGNKRQWYGEDEDGMYTMNLLEDDNSIFGSVTVGDTVYSIGVDADGESVMTARDTADYPPDSPPDDDDVFDGSGNSTRSLAASHEVGALRGTITENHNIMTPSDIGATSLQSENASRALQGVVPSASSILDVMVVWTRNTECASAGLARGCTRTPTTLRAILGRINLAVAETNVAFEKSGIDAEVRLIHAYLDESYIEPSTNAFRRALDAITSTNDGVMDDVHNKRERYGADMVHLMIDDSQFCGIAWLGPRKERMFSVSSWKCATGYYSFGHEIAHNMGCSHDRGTKNNCGTGNNRNKFGFGYRDPAGQFRSIMGYNCNKNQCDNIATNSCSRVQRFSNPNIKYKGKSIGTATEDNARQINNVRQVVADYYQTCEERCDDRDVCTLDKCTDGVCSHTNICSSPMPTVETSAPSSPTPAPQNWAFAPTPSWSNIWAPAPISTPQPTIATPQPTTKEPTPVPTGSPTRAPTSKPTPVPTGSPTRAPTPKPTTSPSPAPIERPSTPSIKNIETTLQAGNGHGGNMFEVEAKKNLKVRRFFIHTDLTKNVKCKVYTKMGNFTVSRGGWELIQKETVRGEGIGKYTALPPLDFPVMVSANQRQAFYIVLTRGNFVRYSNGKLPANQLFVDNDDIQIFEGAGVSNRFGRDGSWTPRIWNGKITYELDDTPTIAPSAPPQGDWSTPWTTVTAAETDPFETATPAAETDPFETVTPAAETDPFETVMQSDPFETTNMQSDPFETSMPSDP